MLEESLAEFPGALVLVTHDRFLLDRLSSVLLALDGEGGAELYAELSQWEQASAAKKAKPAKDTRVPPAATNSIPKKKLSYMETREWERMEALILQAEAALEAKRQELLLPEVVSNPERLIVLAGEIEQAEGEVERLFERWSELEGKKGS